MGYCTLVMVGLLPLAVAVVYAATVVNKRDTQEDTLRQVQVFFRHGQRTPADTYPLDPYINSTFSPYGWGQLTNEGKMEQYLQGQFLRKRYNTFLGDKLSMKEFEGRTTGVDRTKMSMALMLAGLWPPKGDQVWNPDLLWQPVPFTSQELNKDNLLLVRNCPRYTEILDDLLKNNEEVKQKIQSQKELYTYLTEHAGTKISTPEDVMDIYSTLNAEKYLQLKLPDWVTPEIWDKLVEVSAYSFILNSYNQELQLIKAGPMVKKILSDFSDVEADKTKKKFLAYAGHDSTISNLMRAFKVWDPQIPNYNIMAICELHKIDTKYEVKIFLRNTTSHEPYQLTMPGCEASCPLEKVKELMAPIMPPDRQEKMCEPKSSTYVPPKEGGP